ncbi:hypothetical protein [Flexibacterium corallicola]|uniref:hypothetical protein n=1 Tax=Flexibacterium corallicola TaxID=3037259 RepID=UPI00286F8C38|nr:hypothetical protein [Pseudovibrio sp. M1P-2-3]
MTLDSSGAQIDCPIGIFLGVERHVEQLTTALNQASKVEQKAQHAQQLTEALEPLLECQSYDHSNPNCSMCRQFSQLRQKTAAIVMQAARLSQ